MEGGGGGGGERARRGRRRRRPGGGGGGGGGVVRYSVRGCFVPSFARTAGWARAGTSEERYNFVRVFPRGREGVHAAPTFPVSSGLALCHTKGQAARTHDRRSRHQPRWPRREPGCEGTRGRGAQPRTVTDTDTGSRRPHHDCLRRRARSQLCLRLGPQEWPQATSGRVGGGEKHAQGSGEAGDWNVLW